MIEGRAGRTRGAREIAIKLSGLTADHALYLAQIVGEETKTYLRSLTAEMRPPARKGEGSRRAHPGHWADVRGTLANSYGFDTYKSRKGTGATLFLYNTAEYAVYLDVKEGFFVLRGVDEQGGPVEEIVRRVAPQFGWKVR